MAESEQTTILNIEVNYSDGVKAIAEYRTQIDELREAEKKYKKQLKDGEITQQQYNELMTESKLKTAQLNEESRAIAKQLQNQIKAQKAQEGSLQQLRAQLSNLTAAYDNLSEAERKSAKGQELKNQINEVTDALKGGEEETQRYYRNVGNYEQSLSPLFERLEKKIEEQQKAYEKLVKEQGASSKAAKKMKKVLDELQMEFDFMKDSVDDASESVLGFMANGVDASVLKMAKQMGNLATGAKIAARAVMMLGKALLALLANPIVAFLALISSLIMAVSKGIKSSEENTARWNAIMAPLGVILDKVTKQLQDLAGVILTVVETGGKMLGWINKQLEKLPVLGKSFAEQNKQFERYIQLAKEKAAIDRDARTLELDNAKNALKIATLKTTADDELNVSAKKRMEAVREANRLEEEASKRNYELAKRRYEAAVIENDLADNTKETNDAINQAEIEMYKALTEYQEKRRELLGKEVSLQNQIKQQEKERAEQMKAILDKELEEVRAAEDALLQLVTDKRKKASQEIALNYDRQIEDLRKKLSTETDLTIKAREAINTQIVALEKQKESELKELSDGRLKEELDERVKLIELQLSAVKEGTDQEFQLKMQQLIAQREAELSNKELTEQMRLAITDKYDKEADDLYQQREKELVEKQAETLRLRMENEIMELQQKGATELEILREQAEQKLELLNGIHQQEEESEEEFLNRKLQALQDYTDAKQAIADKEVEIEEAKFQAISSVTSSLSGLLDAFSQQSKAAAIASKAIALAEIAVNTGKAIAAGVAQAQSVPFPANLAAIATTIATIMTNVTTAVNTVKSAKFASGGLVTGPGTGTSDSIHAQLSNGESVMTANATSMFAPILSSFNQMGGGVPITVSETSNQAMGEDMLARAFAKGVKNIRPVVSVSEINEVTSRVEVLENLGNI